MATNVPPELDQFVNDYEIVFETPSGGTLAGERVTSGEELLRGLRNNGLFGIESGEISLGELARIFEGETLYATGLSGSTAEDTKNGKFKITRDDLSTWVAKISSSGGSPDIKGTPNI